MTTTSSEQTVYMIARAQYDAALAAATILLATTALWLWRTPTPRNHDL